MFSYCCNSILSDLLSEESNGRRLDKQVQICPSCYRAAKFISSSRTFPAKSKLYKTNSIINSNEEKTVIHTLYPKQKSLDLTQDKQNKT